MPLLDPSLVVVKTVQRDRLPSHHFGVPHPAVVVDEGPGVRHPELLSVFPEALSALPAPDRRGVADDPDLAAVPVVRPLYPRVIAPEVVVVKQEPLHVLTPVVLPDSLPDPSIILLVENLVGLEVQTPGGGALVQRQVGLVGVGGSVYEPGRIPDGPDDPYPGVADSLDHGYRIVGTVADVHYELAHQRQGGQDGLPERIVKPDRVPDESEARYCWRVGHECSLSVVAARLLRGYCPGGIGGCLGSVSRDYSSGRGG